MLEEIGRAMNIVYCVGKIDSGLWVAMRENEIWKGDPDSAHVYNKYCLEAEERFNPLPPLFCVGGLYKDTPFLLVEDVTRGGEYVVQESISGRENIVLVNGRKSMVRAVDFEGDRVPLSEDVDIEGLKYFRSGVRLDI